MKSYQTNIRVNYRMTGGYAETRDYYDVSVMTEQGAHAILDRSGKCLAWWPCNFTYIEILPPNEAKTKSDASAA